MRGGLWTAQRAGISVVHVIVAAAAGKGGRGWTRNTLILCLYGRNTSSSTFSAALAGAARVAAKVSTQLEKTLFAACLAAVELSSCLFHGRCSQPGHSALLWAAAARHAAAAS